MDKPASMSVKEYLIRKMSLSLVVSEKTIDAVITHQFDSANDALNTNKSVEISGFGKFYFNDKKAITLMAKFRSQQKLFTDMLLDESISAQKRRGAEMKLEQAENNIKILKPRINEVSTNI